MPDSAAAIRQKLKNCNLSALFIEELGWNNHRAAPIIVENAGVNFTLNAIAEKHGMVAYECQPDPRGEIPDYPTRGKIERQAGKIALEHIIIFVDKDRTMQTWQWVRREKGKPIARREHSYNYTQSADALIQKLQNLMVSLEEEESITIVDVTSKAKKAFDVDHVTKHFYDGFKNEHDAFFDFITGIDSSERDWYTSLMLNRLMFIYFIQKKSFLDGDIDYMRNRLKMIRQSQQNDKFHTFYRYFLLRLFHEGLSQRERERPEELKKLLGNVPYLNGGLFDVHQLEKDNPDVNIADEAFEHLFDFFDKWDWHLDIRLSRAGNEINPDVLGYIFEKYINQKQMGAYYTKEDITEYICNSTIIPFLFDASAKKCAIAFEPGGTIWQLLRYDPDRYIHDAVLKGIDMPLPEDITVGLSDVSKRGNWNRPANNEFALPTETWREHVDRRTRCLDLRAKIAAGEINNINDLITYNLDLRQFAQDVIETSEGPDLLRAFYKSIEELSVLDPTCGSGAFLFAALNVLEPLYEACLEWMEVFVEESDKSGEKYYPEKLLDFRQVLAQANDRTKHPSRRYFILKSIILNNLYGVDIMTEAVEVCKLRLFLKLVAQIDRMEDVEPLPDIDFNIRAGNTLVGFVSLESVRRSMIIREDGRYRMIMPEDEAALRRIDEHAELADEAFFRFRQQQTEYGIKATPYSEAKSELQTRLSELRMELDQYAATAYGIDPQKTNDFSRWHSSHQPFHWFVEFYGIMKDKGFDVIIGNPPYVEYPSKAVSYIVSAYETLNCGNLYAFIMERCLHILHANGRLGQIIPLPSINTKRMKVFQEMIRNSGRTLWISNYDERPRNLFVGVDQRLSILIAGKYSDDITQGPIFTTGINRWGSILRPYLFTKMYYTHLSDVPNYSTTSILKASREIETSILAKWSKHKPISELLGGDAKNTTSLISYRTAGGRYWKIFLDRPFGTESLSNKVAPLKKGIDSKVVVATLSSNLFWWYYSLHFDMYNLKDYMIFGFRFNYPSGDILDSLSYLGNKLMNNLKTTSEITTIESRTRGTVTSTLYVVSRSKSIIDEIDRVLAKYYGFSDEELDYVINYDIKYRLGADFDEAAEE
jgi:hypothetical protein